MTFDTASVLPVSEDTTLLPEQVCDVVDNTGATGAVVVTLPAARKACGRSVRFASHETYPFIVSSDSSGNIWHRGRSYLSFQVPCNEKGDAAAGAVDVCSNGGQWEVTNVHAPLANLH